MKQPLLQLLLLLQLPCSLRIPLHTCALAHASILILQPPLLEQLCLTALLLLLPLPAHSLQYLVPIAKPLTASTLTAAAISST